MRSLLLVTAVLCSTAAWAQAPADLEAVVTTNLGSFRFEFAPAKAPRHVDQFIARVRQGYYDGSAFFRVVANGIIQGGDPLLKNPKTPKNLWGTGGLNLLAGEFSDMKHERGVVSTVRIPGKRIAMAASSSFVYRHNLLWTANTRHSGVSRKASAWWSGSRRVRRARADSPTSRCEFKRSRSRRESPLRS